MEMEDDHNHNHHHHHHHHQYANMADLRQLINGGAPRPPPHFPADLFAPSAPASGHLSPAAQPHQFEMMMVGTEIIPPKRALQQDFGADNATGGGGEGDLGGGGGGDGGSGRWPRQETLTLLEIRSRLDPKFKEANHKGPLWDEVSRIMCEEHGYQRSGKKCREKFENLYKYYKKTKEGKAGRQDGKHYRFFRQLEALYGETSNNNSQVSVPETHLVNNISRFHSSQSNPQDHGFQSHPKLCDSLSLSANSSEFDTSSSEDNDPSTAVDNECMEKRRKRRGGRSWRAKIKDFIDSQMRKLMEKQEAWLEKVMTTLEHKEQERALREEEWRKQEAARVDREHELWAKERAWIETRDTVLMEMLEKIKGRGRDLSLVKGSSPEERIGGEFQNQNENQNENESQILNNNNNASTGGGRDCWEEPEITRLIQLRSNLESRLQQNGQSHSCDELLWEEIAAKMSCYGYERSSLACKEKWDAINYYLVKKTKEERNKKHKENSRTSCYFHNNDPSMYNQGQGGSYCEIINEQGPPEAKTAARQLQPNDGSSPSSSNAGNAVQDSCFRFLMGDGDQHNLWENYGLKINKGQNQ